MLIASAFSASANLVVCNPTIQNTMLQYFALPTGAGAVVCYDSYSLRGAMAVMECRTLEQARHEAIRRNLSASRQVRHKDRRTSAQQRSARYFENEGE